MKVYLGINIAKLNHFAATNKLTNTNNKNAVIPKTHKIIQTDTTKILIICLNI